VKVSESTTQPQFVTRSLMISVLLCNIIYVHRFAAVYSVYFTHMIRLMVLHLHIYSFSAFFCCILLFLSHYTHSMSVLSISFGCYLFEGKHRAASNNSAFSHWAVPLSLRSLLDRYRGAGLTPTPCSQRMFFYPIDETSKYTSELTLLHRSSPVNVRRPNHSVGHLVRR
jgi:hypothetical protein